ncbi:ExbD/TolR family protein [Fimbriiglobus ruber]|uniref:Biopolymer transport protein ExbD/TolR n=1 Tax=Fimbriiglobus ruber TaxID=1908690 RepID=A0A225D211_9BACT|nr:biopolymer transporter ExbD [Fimbriiglobus ruber]OWK35640.1 hypothetical protein FRUB_08203 [Fimbriiglobus ruber]
MKLKRRTTELAPPFVPMADLVFNLVLFFIILAKTQDDANITWTPAKGTGLQQVANARVTIKVSGDNKIYLNGFETGVRDLADRVSAQLGNAPTDDRLVLLKIHKDTPAATFEPIIEAVSQAGGEVAHVVDEER